MGLNLRDSGLGESLEESLLHIPWLGNDEFVVVPVSLLDRADIPVAPGCVPSVSHLRFILLPLDVYRISKEAKVDGNRDRGRLR